MSDASIVPDADGFLSVSGGAVSIPDRPGGIHSGRDIRGAGAALPEAPAEFFLADMRSRAEAAAVRSREEARTLERREQAVFVSLILVAVATVLVALSSIVLIFINALTVGIASGAIGLLTGGGTLALRSMGQELQGRRQDLLSHERDDRRLLAAIGVALLIPDADRQNKALAELATVMVARMRDTSASPTRRTRRASASRRAAPGPDQ